MNSFQRFKNNITEEMFNKIEGSHIFIAGLGGVGSYALEAIARMGLLKLTICDFDVIEETNINRQLLALNSTIGLKKVDVAEKRLKDINPGITVTKISDKITRAIIEEIFLKKIDFLVDCIDDVNAKIILIKECLKRKIPFISAMGTANKIDPIAFEITDIKKTSYDPLARVIRKALRDEKISGAVPVVSSKEVPLERQSLSSNSFVPATCGLIIASYVLKELMKGNE